MRTLLLPALVATALTLAGCAAPEESDPRPSVVASTDVYASIATAIGGDRIQVTAILSGPDKDPHEYEASARDRLAVSRANLVIRNGGGYDSFLDPMLEADADVLDAADLTGFDADAGGIAGNEHLWYSLSGMESVADAVGDELTALDPAGAAEFAENAAAFAKSISLLGARAAEIAERTAGTPGVVVTERVPLHLLVDLGLEDRTPPQFSEAVEEDVDVAPQVLAAVLELVRDGGVAFLAYNTQTATVQTEQVRAAAEAANLPVLDFTETLPTGVSYLEWMGDNLEQVASVLGVS